MGDTLEMTLSPTKKTAIQISLNPERGHWAWGVILEGLEPLSLLHGSRQISVVVSPIKQGQTMLIDTLGDKAASSSVCGLKPQGDSSLRGWFRVFRGPE